MEVGAWLWERGSEHMAYFKNLEENLEKLRTEKVSLNSRRLDVQCRVEVAEQQPRMRRTKEVEVWLDRAETMENEINVIIREGDQELQNKGVGGCCPKKLQSTYKIGKRLSEMINPVTDLLHKGESFNSKSTVVLRQPRLRLLTDKWPLKNIVGLDSAVERVWRCIKDERIRIISLCGLGGVGKTTLLKKVSNEFHRKIHYFDAVIWAQVPRQEDYIEKVQQVVRRKLDIPDDVWNQCSGEDEKGAKILSVLNGKKFVLLLDNIWEQIDLQRLGIDLLNDQNMSKVIFTTRSLGLYFDTQVTIKVECLPPEQALSLFRMAVGESILSSDPDLSELANTLARRCAGLPLSLLTVAGAMACRRNLREWHHTIDLLHTDPSKIAGMGDYVFPLLKISYDSLNDARTQNCFLYCSLFPEDYNIRIDELIDLWIGEGFLDGPKPCDQGEFIVGTLKLDYLLESDESKQCVRMHDIFRHMALWLARDQGKNKNKVLVAKSGRITDQELTKWEEATWISLFGSSSGVNIDYSPSCHHLSTLIFRDAQLKSFPNGFFDSMPALKVLDLSGNQGLVELPLDFGNVKNLQYLNLSSTSIAKLPTGLINFRKLRCLLLDHTINLKWIPKEVISNLLLLQVYSKINGVTEYHSGYMEDVPYDEAGVLEVLECLNHINKIGITIFAAPSLEKILKSEILRSCIRRLTFMECTGLVSLYFREDLSNLESLGLFNCSSIKEFKVSERCKLGNLSKVYIGFCPLLLNLNFLSYARNLEILIIFCCESLKEVTSEQMPFPRLKTISLTHLQNLKSICPSPRCFPSLLEIEVSKCPRLRQLPFDLENANFLLKIRGETEWWDGLIWDDEAVKDACDVKFVSTPFKGLVKKDHALHIQTECGAFNLSDLPTVAAEALDSPWSLCLHPAPPPPLRLTEPRPPPRGQVISPLPKESEKDPAPPRPKKPEKPKEPPLPAAHRFLPPLPRPKEPEKPKEPPLPRPKEPEKPKEPPRRRPRPVAPPFLPPPPRKAEPPFLLPHPHKAAPLSPRPAPTPCPDVPLRPHPALHPAGRTRPCPAEPPLVMTSESHNDNQLNLKDIDAIKVIGKGNGGDVQLVQHKWTGQFFALKIIQMNTEESARKQIVNILKINESSQCPYVVVCYQSFCTNGFLSIILEYMDGGSLADFLKKVKFISEPYLAAICKQVLKGLMYLHHERHIIHRDLKPSNLLINHRGEVKINDFGVSAILTSSSGRTNTFVGTYNYMSPERIIGGSYDITADIWSLGLVLLECATGKFPYSPPEQAEGWTNIFELMEEIVEQPPPCAPSDQFSPEFCSFISACLQKDPKERKSSHELLALPFLNMYDDMDVDLSSYFTDAGSLIAIDRTQNVIMLEKKSKKERTDKREQKRAKID